MALHRLLAGVVLALLAVVAAGGAVDKDERLDELLQLRAASKGGLFTMSDEQFQRFGLTKSRSYTLIVLLNANQVSSNPQLNIPKLRKEINLAARASAVHNIFWAEMTYETDQEVFRLVGANHVPYMFRLGPELLVDRHKLNLPSNEVLSIQGSAIKYPWKAEDLVGYFLAPRNQGVEVVRPNPLKSPWFPVVVVASLPALLFVAWKLYFSPLVQRKPLWCTLALLVFWFASSGGMFNIIRGMPLYMHDKEGKLQLFMSSRQGQLGAEGFIMGALYFGFSSCLAVLAMGLPYVKSGVIRNGGGVAFVTAAAYAVFKIMELWMSKSSYSYVSYF